MKKTVVAFILAILTAMLCACGAAKYSTNGSKVSEYDNSTMNDKVCLYIQQRTITDETDEFTITLENLTDMDYTYDAAQRLELYDGSKWHVVHDKQDAVSLIIYTLPSGCTDELSFNVAAHYDKLTEGRYRVVVPLVAEDGTQTIASAEFGIGRVEA